MEYTPRDDLLIDMLEAHRSGPDHRDAIEAFRYHVVGTLAELRDAVREVGHQLEVIRAQDAAQTEERNEILRGFGSVMESALQEAGPDRSSPPKGPPSMDGPPHPGHSVRVGAESEDRLEQARRRVGGDQLPTPDDATKEELIVLAMRIRSMIACLDRMWEENAHQLPDEWREAVERRTEPLEAQLTAWLESLDRRVKSGGAP